MLGKKTVSEKEWRAILGSTSTSQTSMNNFVMDYLVTEVGTEGFGVASCLPGCLCRL